MVKELRNQLVKAKKPRSARAFFPDKRWVVACRAPKTGPAAELAKGVKVDLIFRWPCRIVDVDTACATLLAGLQSGGFVIVPRIEGPILLVKLRFNADDSIKGVLIVPRTGKVVPGNQAYLLLETGDCEQDKPRRPKRTDDPSFGALGGDVQRVVLELDTLESRGVVLTAIRKDKLADRASISTRTLRKAEAYRRDHP